ncbi:hypothetical protein VNI00_004881 [Paramarasmius palmivorus]|uniref:Uncharacterized protein n=1 Tax=Paramarasmius palmivorus TaxID=297713 RepID=A0AAW0DF37_9AGAR
MHGDGIPLPRLGARCPPPNVRCEVFEIDHIKLFYHPDNGDEFLPEGSYTIYIARPGSLQVSALTG